MTNHCDARLGSFAPRRAASGGARRSRTDDILLAKQALYQLSYGPISGSNTGELSTIVVAGPAELVGPGRLELPTLRLSGVRSNQAELRAFGGTTARQIPRLAIALPTTPTECRMLMEAKEERETETAAPRSLLEFQ